MAWSALYILPWIRVDAPLVIGSFEIQPLKNLKRDKKLDKKDIGEITSIVKHYKDKEGISHRCHTKELKEKAMSKGWTKMRLTKHTRELDNIGGGSNRLERYRIPALLIEELFEN